jgi:hypothetical protein
MVQDSDKSNGDLVYMASFWKENQLVRTKKMLEGELIVWRTKLYARVQGCSFLFYFVFFFILFYFCCSKFEKLWIEDIVKSILTHPFLMS